MQINHVSKIQDSINTKFKNALNAKSRKEHQFAKAVEFYCIELNSRNSKGLDVPAFEVDKISKYLNLTKLEQSLSKLNITLIRTNPNFISFRINNDKRQHRPTLENIDKYINL